MLELSKELTGQSNETVAMEIVKLLLTSDDQWHGDVNFPENESNEQAHLRCTDDISAAKYCPRRTKSIKKWEKVKGFVIII